MDEDLKDTIKAVGLAGLLIGVPALLSVLYNKHVEKQTEKKRGPIAEEME